MSRCRSAPRAPSAGWPTACDARAIGHSNAPCRGGQARIVRAIGTGGGVEARSNGGQATLTLTAVAQTLVSDVANVIRIDTFRSTPLIVDGSTNAKLAHERTLSLWPGFIAQYPFKLLQEPARLHAHLSHGINPGYKLAQECAAVPMLDTEDSDSARPA